MFWIKNRGRVKRAEVGVVNREAEALRREAVVASFSTRRFVGIFARDFEMKRLTLFLLLLALLSYLRSCLALVRLLLMLLLLLRVGITSSKIVCGHEEDDNYQIHQNLCGDQFVDDFLAFQRRRMISILWDKS